jgi:acetoin utilization protein AcuC
VLFLDAGRAVEREKTAVFIGSDFCRRPAYGVNHPLSIPRVGTVLRLCEQLGWLDREHYRPCTAASIEQLQTFHDRAYLEALRQADETHRVTAEVRERFGIGTLENPLFPELFTRAATQVGGSILAAELALEGRVSFHPAGGTHHGLRDRASGFCYFNDPVFAIRRLQKGGVDRVLYADLDAHHGDGVQLAFEYDPGVATISIHESGRWPYSGAADDRGGGNARNLPVPAGFNDSELAYLMSEVVVPHARQFSPGAVVVTCGTDALSGDPLSRMALSNGALWAAVEQLACLTRKVVVLGGGGYNPWTLARCWTGLWGRLSGRGIPATLPAGAVDILNGLSCDLIDEDEVKPEWKSTLRDVPNSGPVRDEVRDLARVHRKSTAQRSGRAQRRMHELA